MTKDSRPSPLLLTILDGWGHSEKTENNAIAAARKPTWDHLWNHYPHTLLSGSGRCVGLPEGQMGNSEVGHLSMGSGRTIQQDLTRIDDAIADGTFFNNATLLAALALAKKNKSSIHLLGLLSPGGVHSHENHFYALLKLAAQEKNVPVYIHAFLDGRDTPPQSAMTSINKLTAVCQELNCGEIVSIIGRYYAMDRDKRWPRVAAAYHLLAQGAVSHHAATAAEGLQAAYARGETDEFVQATALNSSRGRDTIIENNDVVIFMNFRADRARELTESFTDPTFSHFAIRKELKLGAFICLTEYDARYTLPIAFPPIPLTHLLGECLSRVGLKQLRIAETEKYAHVTFFFNGGIDTPFPLEERLLIPSPQVATYDLQPEMSAKELTQHLVSAIRDQTFNVIICNFANPDMVGHTGNFDATVAAIETVDECLGKIVAALSEVGGEMIITADHGNAEKMFNSITNQPHTAHTSDPVPFIYVGRKGNISIQNGKLSDIAPTILHLLALEQPEEMTGRCLVNLI